MLSKNDQIKICQKYYTDLWHCDCDIFNRKENVILKSYDDGLFEYFTFGGNAVMRADESIFDWCNENLLNMDANRILGSETLNKFLCENNKFDRHEGVRYLYLYETDIAKPQNYTYKLYENDEIYKNIPENSAYRMALGFAGDDVIAIAAYDGDSIVSIAGADNRMGDIWQVGIDTLPEYRQRGLGVYLVKTISDEIVKRGKLPFYTTWSLNMASTTIALNSGYRPIWVYG